MYNLNVDLATSAQNAVNSLLVDGAATTPRTPEILNSLIAMTNPLDQYAFDESAPGKKPPIRGASFHTSSDSNSSSSSQVESPTTNPPSVQHTCSQLIKAGLKLTIEQKRRHHGDGEDLLDLDKVKRIKKNDYSESEDDKIKTESGVSLTAEDEERRRRRRERNKIAATKCRLKKRERTINLIQESETLETQNVELKAQMQELQTQKQTLFEMLSIHRPQCQHNIGPVTRDHLHRLPPVGTVIDGHPFGDPASYRSHNGDYSTASRPSSHHHHLSYTKLRPPPPSIVVEQIGGDFELAQFTDLDGGYPYGAASPCHGGYAGQGYNNGGMDNGCMA
ncbi:unnamed protein product [Phyllotreta striolata]|uniref:BZIP domain-containing protein n=1 Tax=Phyllotreta striolata TaxID=444603 RepID=A0A9P0DU22_PHYSR|nr:unnamed protein product [Phyllotreta striolata]